MPIAVSIGGKVVTHQEIDKLVNENGIVPVFHKSRMIITDLQIMRDVSGCLFTGTVGFVYGGYNGELLTVVSRCGARLAYHFKRDKDGHYIYEGPTISDSRFNQLHRRIVEADTQRPVSADIDAAMEYQVLPRMREEANNAMVPYVQNTVVPMIHEGQQKQTQMTIVAFCIMVLCLVGVIAFAGHVASTITQSLSITNKKVDEVSVKVEKIDQIRKRDNEMIEEGFRLINTRITNEISEVRTTMTRMIDNKPYTDETGLVLYKATGNDEYIGVGCDQFKKKKAEQEKKDGSRQEKKDGWLKFIQDAFLYVLTAIGVCFMVRWISIGLYFLLKKNYKKGKKI